MLQDCFTCPHKVIQHGKHLLNGENQELELFSGTIFLPDLEIFSGTGVFFSYIMCFVKSSETFQACSQLALKNEFKGAPPFWTFFHRNVTL